MISFEKVSRFSDKEILFYSRSDEIRRVRYGTVVAGVTIQKVGVFKTKIAHIFDLGVLFQDEFSPAMSSKKPLPGRYIMGKVTQYFTNFSNTTNTAVCDKAVFVVKTNKTTNVCGHIFTVHKL